MKSVLEYLYGLKKQILIFFLFCGVFALVFGLYGLPLSAVAYSGGICAFFGVLVLGRSYGSWKARLGQLEILKKELNVSLDGLPEPQNVLEGRYQELLRELYSQKQQLVTDYNSRYQELVEYYTIWAHQIKTPIAAMDLILQQEDSAVNRQIDQELRRIRRYVEMVLVVLRLDSESTDYMVKEYELDDIIRQAVRGFASSFIYKKMRLVYEPIHKKVLTDEKWLLFVLEQLLSNALKYTKKGSIEILLEEPLTLCIRDSGMGIAPEDLPRIFEKGYTGYNGRKDKKASGIGLYLCRRICRKLNHDISVDSVLDKGTIVRINLYRERRRLE